MENGQPEDQDKDMDEVNSQIAQLQALTAELRDELVVATEDLSSLKQRDRSLEEAVRDYQSDTEEKILGLRNSLDTLKEDLAAALLQIGEVNSRHREIQQGLERFQTKVGRELLSAPQRKGSKEDFLSHEHKCVSSETELSIIQHYFASLPNSSPKNSRSASTQGQEGNRPSLAETTCNSTVTEQGGEEAVNHTSSNFEQELGFQQQQQQQKGGAMSPVWGKKGGRVSADNDEGDSTQENSKRQAAALELLESERVYVSYLSLLLKANITFNGSEAVHLKHKRAFPSSLRFLIQQHLELLHILQERVLKCQWQGIMGDVFMRLTSKESDFLDYYVAYLKELPECLSAVSVYSATSLKSVGLFEGDMRGNESHPTLHSLLLQPVQRIPEYLLLLQNLTKHTDCEHPDYYLLLVCIQQFRAFTGQHSHLLQHNEELLLQNRKQLKRSAMKQFFKTVDCSMQADDMGSPCPPSKAPEQHTSQVRKQRHLEQVQSKSFSDWEAESRRYDPAPGGVPFMPFFTLDPDPRLKSPAMQSIPEAEPETGPVEGPPRKRQLPGGTLADAIGGFLPLVEGPGLKGPCEDCDSQHNVSLFDNVSTASSESSVDIAFVLYPKSHEQVAHGDGGRRSSRYRLPARGCVSPDEESMMRHRPLQAVQHKSKSLNGLQLDSTVSADASPATGYRALGGHAHPRLERQPSKGSTNNKLQRSASPAHKLEDDIRNTTEEEPHRDHDKDCAGGHAWAEQPRWRDRPESRQAPFSHRSRKQDQKGGIRSSFKKLFKKKSGGDSKDKGSDKSEVYSDHESMKSPRVTQPGDIDRGTAV